MKNLIKTLLLAAFALAPVASVLPALAADSQDMQFKKPEDLNRLPAENPALFGFKNSSTTAAGAAVYNWGDQINTAGRQWVTGKGVLEDILLSTGPATTYVVCMDSAATTNTTITDLGWTNLYPPMFANVTQASRAFGTATSGSGPPPPLFFRDGLYCWASGLTRYTPVWRAKAD